MNGALREVGDEIRNARLSAGLSQGAVGQRVSMSHSQVSRIERARLPSVSVEQLVAVSTVLGLRLSIRAYPDGIPIRDTAHLALLAKLCARLAPSLGWRVEVPIAGTADSRAWDAVIFGAGPAIGIEAETRLRDVQAIERRIALKLRDSGLEPAVLLLADTRSNRAAIRADPDELHATFPVRRRELLRALAEGRDPGGSALVLL
ncbi:MAG: helix-turn-helix domain-containing protein [Chloroflexota bacterium]